MTIYPVILAGGSGTRLWPLSREYYPKQFLPLTSASSSMLQETLARLELIREAASPILVCSELHRFIITDQLREAGVEATSIIVEPAGRNTAPALALGALRAQDAADDDDDPTLLVTHSDHLITEPQRFLDAFRVGLALASDGNVVTFGVPPTGPETGYGYVEKGDPISSVHGAAFAIQSFVGEARQGHCSRLLRIRTLPVEQRDIHDAGIGLAWAARAPQAGHCGRRS